MVDDTVDPPRARPFCNNLKQNDRVFDTETKRQGKVARTPRSDKQRLTAVILDGTNTPRYIDVMQLRFMVDGKPEDVPPIDGTPPPDRIEIVGKTRQVDGHGDAISALKSELEQNEAEMKRIETRFKELRDKNERINKAVDALTKP